MSGLRERVARELHSLLSRQDVMAYLDGKFDCDLIADAIIPVILAECAKVAREMPRSWDADAPDPQTRIAAAIEGLA